MIYGEDEICPNSIISFQDKDSVKQAIAADLGVAVMASSFAGEEDPYVEAGLIYRVALTDVPLNMMHVLITPKKRKFTIAEKCFLEELEQYYQKRRNVEMAKTTEYPEAAEQKSTDRGEKTNESVR